jgi:hypothetical protein
MRAHRRSPRGGARDFKRDCPPQFSIICTCVIPRTHGAQLNCGASQMVRNWLRSRSRCRPGRARYQEVVMSERPARDFRRAVCVEWSPTRGCARSWRSCASLNHPRSVEVSSDGRRRLRRRRRGRRARPGAQDHRRARGFRRIVRSSTARTWVTVGSIIRSDTAAGPGSTHGRL